jgi:hypothetical protein
MPICESCSTKWGVDDKKPCYFCINKGMSLTFFKRDYPCDMCQSSNSWVYYKKLDMCDSCKEEECKKRKPLNIISSKNLLKSSPNLTCKYCKKKCFNQEVLDHHCKKNCLVTNSKSGSNEQYPTEKEEGYDWRKEDKEYAEFASKSEHVESKSIKDQYQATNIKGGQTEYLEKLLQLETKVDGNTINCEEVIKCMEELDVTFKNTTHHKITVVDLFADNIVSKNSIVYSEPPKTPN